MKTKVTIVALMIMLGFATASIAQCNEWKWPEDKATAEEKYVLHNDLVKNGQFEKAIAPHQWLLQNAPDLNTAIFINGEKIFTGLADKEKDAAKKQVYVDSLMMIYDMRMEQCGEEDKVSDRKALYAFKYMYKDKSKTAWLMEVYDKALDLNGEKMMSSNFKYYFTVVKMNKLYHDNLTEEDILNKYDKVIAAIDKSIAKKDSKKLQGIRSDINTMLSEIVTINCDFVRTNFGPKFEENPEDIELAKKIFKFMLDDKCVDDPLWLKAGELIVKTDPDYGLYKNLAIQAKAKGDKDKAEEYFQKALEIAGDDEDASDVLIQLGHLDREAGRKVDARSHYREAGSKGDKEAYTYIGYLYMTSFEQCAGRVSKVQDRLVFLAAYKYFQMAGNTKQMAAAKEQFPSVGEIFEENVTKGSTMKVGCWIGESVTVDTRD